MRSLEIERYKHLLEDKYEDLLKAIRQREAIAVERSADVIDELQAGVERERAITELDRTSRLLRDVKAALVRIGEGTYGVCLRCDQPISPVRLKAVPWTPFCIRCQQEVDDGATSDRDRTTEYFPHAA
jgi:DnaK suppressor protein